MNHNFTIVPNHPKARPGFNVWHCDNCDSEAIFKAKYTKHDVNQIITAKIKCLPPVSSGIIV